MLVKERTFEELVLADPERPWEMRNGHLVEKPAMTDARDNVMWRLVRQLLPRVDYDRFDLRANTARVRVNRGRYVIPDVCIVASPGNWSLDRATHRVVVITEPLLFVAEVWSPSTGDYDVDEKTPEYRARGDHEIWRVHPVERRATMWRLINGSYAESDARGVQVRLATVPGVVIDIDDLFR